MEGATRTVEVTVTGGRVASVATTAGEGRSRPAAPCCSAARPAPTRSPRCVPATRWT
ncbi:hypothetical protein V2I01_06815 [Micromonospora sp. BRA006-A]|nr:hypothetical protein [Micromonospora sp. BRA006-A]